jgi:brefeldin A-inhibited guanine nucleotide-exchange protein
LPITQFLQKLVEYGYIRGVAADEDSPDKKLVVKVVNTISNCFDFPDDNVQLQIIKVRLISVLLEILFRRF